MKKLAINFLKTADEKLRNIGKSQSSTVLQTQNFAFYKNQPNRENEYHVNPQFPLEQQSTHKVLANRGAGPISIQPQSGSGTDDMDEPVLLRQLHRERKGHRISGEAEQEDFKRRSRSEGPNRRVRQSMDERANVKKQTFDGGGRGRKQHESSDSGENNECYRQTTGDVGFVSESDSDPKKLTKNLLVVRRVRKTEKTKQSEKRFSERENGASRTESLGGGGASSRDSESSTKGSNKYHKLEEMRKNRINMVVTSDEENTPASRISRLRQRALQGGLGDQLKSINAPLASTSYSNTYVDYARRDHSQVPHQAHKTAPSDAGIQNLIEVNSEWRLQNVLSSTNQHKAGTNSPTQSRPYSNRPFPEPIHNINSSFAIGTSTQKQSVPPTVKNPILDFHSGLNQQSPRAQQIQTILQQSQHQKQAPVRIPPFNNSGSHQLFYTIPEPNSSQTSKTMDNCSPELAVHRFTSQMRLPYTDSIVNSTPKTGMTPGYMNPTVSFSNNLKQIQARGSPIPNQELFQSINSSRSYSHFTDVDEIKSKKNIDRRIEPQPKLQNNPVAKFNSFGYNADTLDELDESSNQYLDSDVDKFRPIRNSSTNVSRSSSLPDPRKMSTTPSLMDQSSTQVQSNDSIQIHVSLPTDPKHNGLDFNQPIIQIAPPGVISYESKYDPVDHLMPQPDVVPRKYSYDSHSRLSRTSGEYYDRGDMSKSDSQLNAQVVMIPSYLGNNSLQPDQAYVRGCVSDINLRVDDGDGFTVSQMDRGMFSDVENDIQVSERVKRWETFMKVQDDQIPNEQKSLTLTPIQENIETDSLMLPSEVKKSVLLSKSSAFVPLYSKEIKSAQTSQSRPFSSDISLNKSADVDALKMFYDESKTKRFFKIIHDTQVASQLGGSQTQNVSSLLHTTVTSQSDNTFLSAHEIRQQMMSNRQTTPSVPRNNSQTSFPSPQFQLTEYKDGSQKGASLMARSSNLSDHRDLGKKDSQYHEEYNEIASAKTDSMINLRRRFGADSVAGTSEDDQWSVSSASSKLIRPSKTSTYHSQADSMDLFSFLPGYEPKIKDADVWSPNLETTHGVPVSIERVTARTLQTIPFSEDPFWKEIEEMTSFDPNSLAGHLGVSKALDLVTAVELVKSDIQVELTSPHTSTLPTQSRSNSLAQRDRMQRSKSLYTPNITPQSINVSEKSSSSVSVLDDVLEDINRSSIERKQISPKKKALETSSIAVLGVSNVTDYLKIKQAQPEVGFKFEGGQFTFIKPASESQPRATKSHVSTDLSQSQADTVIFQSKQPLQFYQQQRKDAQQQLQNRQSQLLMGGVSSYHLDPNLLKQKLLNTGLVVETDTEESIVFKQTRSSSLGAPGPIFVSLSKTAQTNAPSESKGVRQKETAQLRSSFISSKSDADLSEVEHSPAAPWAVKKPGPSALYDIQNALAPFEPSIYQPDPEILYDMSRLQSFNETNFNTSKGSHVTATGWTYQPQLNQDTEIHKTLSSSSNSVSKLQKVNVSVDDLKNLAQNVERQINAIKGKLQSADEKSLDSILTSLRKLTPEAKSQVADGTDFVDYYSAKKAKLSDALTELNRIYDDLELSNSGPFHLSEKGKDTTQRATKSKELFITPISKLEHLRPMQTRVSSVFIPGLERSSSTQKLDHETESEFDILSKSFQAIVDEVNQTTDLFTQIAENNTLENVAPETKNQASKIALNSDRGNYVKTVSTSSKEKNAASSNLTPATMLKPHEVKCKGDRLRAKLQGSFKEDDLMIGKGRYKSIPGLGSTPKELLGETKENVDISSSVPTDTSSPTLLQRMRIRPVRDNKIVKDDKVAKKQGTDKASGISQSPHPSPIVNRKIIYNNGYVPDVTPHSAHVVKEETAVQSPKLHKFQITQKINSSKEMVHGITETKLTISSPGGSKKVPPPTAAKPTRLETSLSNTVSSELAPSLVAMPSISLKSKLQTATQFNSNKHVFPKKYIVGSIPHQTSTTVSINLSPMVLEARQSKIADSKYDDTENNFSGGHRDKKQIGIGLAMILDKFTIDEEIPDRITKRLGIRSAPDLIEPLIDCQDETDLPSNETLNLKSETSVSGDNIQQTSKVVKCQTQQPADKRISLLATEGSKSIVSKPIVVSALERSVFDSEGKTSSSGTTTPQSPSPNRKPPQHPCKRLMSETDKQIESEVISESVMSPKFISKIPRFIAAQRTVAAHSKADEANKTPKTDSHLQPIDSPRAIRRERPPDRKMQTAIFRERPHSFHELISCFEKGTSHVQSVQRLRKYASADEVDTDKILKKVLFSEVNPTTGNILGMSGEQSSSVRCS